MLQIRFHGRGGQGAQTAGDIMASAFYKAGNYVQAFSTYGGARRGTPVSTFIRVDDKPIRLRCDIENPDAIVCFDPSLIDVLQLNLLSNDTKILINSINTPEHFPELAGFQISTIDGLSIAKANNLGRIVNSALLGGLAALIKAPDIDLLCSVVRAKSPVKLDQNVQACLAGYNSVQNGER